MEQETVFIWLAIILLIAWTAFWAWWKYRQHGDKSKVADDAVDALVMFDDMCDRQFGDDSIPGHVWKLGEKMNDIYEKLTK